MCVCVCVCVVTCNALQLLHTCMCMYLWSVKSCIFQSLPDLLYCVGWLRERHHQKNFQLIIITHDLKFVEQLGRSEFVEDYNNVSKEVG